VKPTLNTPLRAGVWTVEILTIEQDLIYKVKFLVLPLEVYQGNPISSSEEWYVQYLFCSCFEN